MPKRTVDDIVAEIPTRAMMPPGQESRVDRALRTLDPDHAPAPVAGAFAVKRVGASRDASGYNRMRSTEVDDEGVEPSGAGF